MKILFCNSYDLCIVSLHLQLINLKCAGNDDMIEMVMNSLLGRLVDSSHQVRMLCIRGLGNVASNEKQQVNKNKYMFLG